MEICLTNSYFTLIILMHQQINSPVISGMMRRFMDIMIQQNLKMMAGSLPMGNLFILPKALQTTVTVVVLVQATQGGGHGSVVTLFMQCINS